ncbi:MAG: hypothetical protein ACOC56_04135 [Atribacterota bacterium]
MKIKEEMLHWKRKAQKYLSQQKKTCGDMPLRQQDCCGIHPEEKKVSKENDTTYSADINNQGDKK